MSNRAGPAPWSSGWLLLASMLLGVAAHAAESAGTFRAGAMLDGAGSTDSLPVPTADERSLLPVGDTHQPSQLELREMRLEAWRDANLALTSHVRQREEHVLDLERFVAHQDAAIASLAAEVKALEDLVSGPGSVARVALPVASELPPADDAPSPRDEWFLAPVFLEGGMLAMVVALGAWIVCLQARDRRLGRERGRSSASGVGRLLPSGPVMAPAGKDKEFLAEAHDRAASALIASIRGGHVAHEYRMELMRVLRGEGEGGTPSTRSPFSGDANGEEGTLVWLEPVRSDFDSDEGEHRHDEGGEDIEDWQRSTVVMSAATEPEPAHLVPAPPRAAKTTTNTSALLEVDTLIAFENYDQASGLLNQLLDVSPDNPEYRLRLLHILSAAGEARASAEQEEILAALMDGPLSETLDRVRVIGRDLLPGHPLFQDRSLPPATQFTAPQSSPIELAPFVDSLGDPALTDGGLEPESDLGFDLDLDDLVAEDAAGAFALPACSNDPPADHGATVFELRSPLSTQRA